MLSALLALALVIPQSNPSIEQRVADTLSQMTLDEKIDILSGVRDFYERGVTRLNVPELRMSDGPAGVRNYGPTTAYPAPVSVAASFDTDLANQFGVAIGRDARSRGVHIWLGPGVNLARIPQNGRNFEYYGEDPFLSGQTVANVVRGVQSQGVVATVKHYAANNHENDRMVDSSDVDERVLRELYLKPFEAAVKEGGAWAVMCAYNKLNGTYCSANPFLLTQVLKRDWGFHGILMSDWGAVHDTLGPLNAGLDLEMPSGDYLNPRTVKPLLQDGQVQISTIDDKVRRILRMTYAMGFDQRPQLDESIPKDDPKNESVALQIAREGTVLLKNRAHLLPLNPHRRMRIMVVGPNADPAVTGGGGSAYTTPASTVSLLQAIKEQVGSEVTIDYQPLVERVNGQAFRFSNYTLPSGDGPGLLYEEFNNQNLAGAPSVTRNVRGVRIQMANGAPGTKLHFSGRWTGTVKFAKTSPWRVLTRSDDGIRVYIDDKLVIDDWNDHGETTDDGRFDAVAGRTYRLKVEYYQNEGDAVARLGFEPVMQAPTDLPVQKLRTADAIVASVGFSPASESEGQDHPFDLPFDQDSLLRTIVALNPHVIVVNNSGAGVNMLNWSDGAGAIIQAWYPGGVGNQAIAEIVFGKTNPSGKLPTTFPRGLGGTYYATAYPPVNHHVVYKEGLFMGYRWFDHNKVDPLFPFGFGLSYTSFHFDRFAFHPDGERSARLTVRLTNRGDRDGTEVVQVYVHKRDSAVVRPEKELKAFKRVFMHAGESRDVEVPLRLEDVAYWDTPGHRWIIEPGKYDLLVGDSSRNLPLKGFLDMGPIQR